MHISSQECPHSVKPIQLVLFGELCSIKSCQEVINGAACCHAALVIFGDANREQQFCLRNYELIQEAFTV